MSGGEPSDRSANAVSAKIFLVSIYRKICGNRLWARRRVSRCLVVAKSHPAVSTKSPSSSW